MFCNGKFDNDREPHVELKSYDELKEFDPLDIDELEIVPIRASRAERWPTSMAGGEAISASRHSIVGKAGA